MRVKTEVEKGDSGEVKVWHVDCPTPTDSEGGVVNRESGMCSDCGVEIPKNLMSSAASKTLRGQLNERFEPNTNPKDQTSGVGRIEGSREIDHGNTDGGETTIE